MRQIHFLLLACAIAAASPVQAQGVAPTNTAPDATPAPSTGLPGPPPSEAGAPIQDAPPPSAACVPQCRSGFTCVSGQCVSSCNPPCSSGDVCTAAGECIAPRAESVRPSDTIDGPVGTVHRHDGFFLRLTLGIGAGAAGLDAKGDTDDRGFVGGGWASSIDVGGANGDNLAFFVRLREATLASPAVYIDNDKIRDADASALTQGMFGGGISYFIMPLNMYLGAAVGLAAITGRYHRPGRSTLKYNGNVGFGFDGEIGKEWWVADDWGIGVAARLSIAEVPGGDSVPDGANFGAAFVSLLFSATYQ
jgi:hypothetical protein